MDVISSLCEPVYPVLYFFFFKVVDYVSPVVCVPRGISFRLTEHRDYHLRDFKAEGTKTTYSQYLCRSGTSRSLSRRPEESSLDVVIAVLS